MSPLMRVLLYVLAAAAATDAAGQPPDLSKSEAERIRGLMVDRDTQYSVGIARIYPEVNQQLLYEFKHEEDPYPITEGECPPDETKPCVTIWVEVAKNGSHYECTKRAVDPFKLYVKQSQKIRWKVRIFSAPNPLGTLSFSRTTSDFRIWRDTNPPRAATSREFDLPIPNGENFTWQNRHYISPAQYRYYFSLNYTTPSGRTDHCIDVDPIIFNN